jgi:tetratricopeptide (TPR) repeat protein
VGDAQFVAQLRTIAYIQQQDRSFGLWARSCAMLWLGDLDQALNDANASISTAPSETGYALRADIRWARGELEQAASDYTFVLRLVPGSAEWLTKRASVYDALGKQSEASADLESLARLGGSNDKRGHATIWRVSQKAGAGGGQYGLYIDGIQRARLVTGEAYQVSLSPGFHEFQTKWGPYIEPALFVMLSGACEAIQSAADRRPDSVGAL